LGLDLAVRRNDGVEASLLGSKRARVERRDVARNVE
jgi:hypothetical protein